MVTEDPRKEEGIHLGRCALIVLVSFELASVADISIYSLLGGKTSELLKSKSFFLG